jgi:Mg-chelatase subunit ChlI
MKRTVFPFIAVIGQDAVKKALILNIVNPALEGF